MNCKLVILACNTASAKALRSIQQNDLPKIDAARRVLGVIRPSAEAVGEITRTRHVGILATPGTVMSDSYRLEIKKLYPDITTTQQSCPLWVPLVENGEHAGPGADYFIKKNIDELFAQDSGIDTVVLGCTHYPLMIDKIRAAVPQGITILTQGGIVTQSLALYLQRHAELETHFSQGGSCRYYTSEDPHSFSRLAGMFMGSPVSVEHISLG